MNLNRSALSACVISGLSNAREYSYLSKVRDLGQGNSALSYFILPFHSLRIFSLCRLYLLNIRFIVKSPSSIFRTSNLECSWKTGSGWRRSCLRDERSHDHRRSDRYGRRRTYRRYGRGSCCKFSRGKRRGAGGLS